jgi:hypothetical protein
MPVANVMPASASSLGIVLLTVEFLAAEGYHSKRFNGPEESMTRL